jgi:N-acetyl-alpha-D-glucosaminyl L-malate synthase BshA
LPGRRQDAATYCDRHQVNIAILCYHQLGGSGILAHEMGVSLADTGRHHVHFVGLEPPFRYLEKYRAGISFHQIEMHDYPVWVHSPYTLSLASQLADLIDDNKIDIVHSHYAIPHAVAAILAEKIAGRRVGTVTTLHGTDITLVGAHPTFRSVTKYAIQESDEVTAVSDFLVSETEDLFDIPKGRIRKIYNFVNRREFGPNVQACRACDAVPGRKIVAHASNLRPVKAPLDVIRIFHGIVEACDCGPELWIIGNGPMQSEMTSLSRELGIQDKVRFLGVQMDMPSLLAQCDLFLLPSRQESFGLAALEAMACGVPVVASRAGGLPEVIEDGVSGCLVPAGDVDSAVRASCRLLEDAVFAERVRENALQTVANKFDQAEIVRQYEDLYASALSPGATRDEE